MGRPRILDAKIMSKIATKVRKSGLAVSGMVSRMAAKHNISAEAALILLAKKHAIGTATYQRRLDAAKQGEVRAALPGIFASGGQTSNNKHERKRVGPARPGISRRASLKLAVEYLIQDQELRERCQDILLAPKNFDRPVNQATLVLEDRIRSKAQPPTRLVGENLVAFAFNEDLAKTVLRVASNDSDDQRGFTQMLRGIVPAFRNKTHHHIIRGFSREDAMRVCGFIDVLLRVVDNSVKVR